MRLKTKARGGGGIKEINACMHARVLVRLCACESMRETVLPEQQSSAIKWLVKEQRSVLIECVQLGGFEGPRV